MSLPFLQGGEYPLARGSFRGPPPSCGADPAPIRGSPHVATRWSRCAISDLGRTPTMRSTARPPAKISKAGMLRTLKRDAVAGFSSTFSFANRTRPAISDASSSTTGAIIRHGLHQGAHMSTSTGSGEPSTSVEKFASVTVIGPEPAERGVLHRPQIGLSPPSILTIAPRDTRLIAPQD